MSTPWPLPTLESLLSYLMGVEPGPIYLSYEPVSDRGDWKASIGNGWLMGADDYKYFDADNDSAYEALRKAYEAWRAAK